MTKETSVNIVQLKETIYQKPTELYSVIENCVLCGERHIHGPKEGYRSGHCIDRNSVVYKIVIDSESEENIRLAEKYGIQLKEGNEV